MAKSVNNCGGYKPLPLPKKREEKVKKSVKRTKRK